MKTLTQINADIAAARCPECGGSGKVKPDLETALFVPGGYDFVQAAGMLSCPNGYHNITVEDRLMQIVNYLVWCWKRPSLAQFDGAYTALCELCAAEGIEPSNEENTAWWVKTPPIHHLISSIAEYDDESRMEVSRQMWAYLAFEGIFAIAEEQGVEL
jgi:hypothetical protein